MSKKNQEIAPGSVEGRILSSLFHHNNFPAYDFQITSRINSGDIPEAELQYLAEEGYIERSCTYVLTNKGLKKAKEFSQSEELT